MKKASTPESKSRNEAEYVENLRIKNKVHS